MVPLRRSLGALFTVGLTVLLAHPSSAQAQLSSALQRSLAAIPSAAVQGPMRPLWSSEGDLQKDDPAPLSLPTAVPLTPLTTAVLPAAPQSYRDRLIGGAGLNAAVAVYSDCSGRTPLTHAAAAIDTCISGRTYFVGHNPGVFTPLMQMSVGSRITWYDDSGTAHSMRIVAIQSWQHNGYPPAMPAGAQYQFQTCITIDGSLDRVLDAAAI